MGVIKAPVCNDGEPALHSKPATFGGKIGRETAYDCSRQRVQETCVVHKYKRPRLI